MHEGIKVLQGAEGRVGEKRKEDHSSSPSLL
jgi:hypothetical protein